MNRLSKPQSLIAPNPGALGPGRLVLVVGSERRRQGYLAQRGPCRLRLRSRCGVPAACGDAAEIGCRRSRLDRGGGIRARRRRRRLCAVVARARQRLRHSGLRSTATSAPAAPWSATCRGRLLILRGSATVSSRWSRSRRRSRCCSRAWRRGSAPATATLPSAWSRSAEVERLYSADIVIRNVGRPDGGIRRLIRAIRTSARGSGGRRAAAKH